MTVDHPHGEDQQFTLARGIVLEPGPYEPGVSHMERSKEPIQAGNPLIESCCADDSCRLAYRSRRWAVTLAGTTGRWRAHAWIDCDSGAAGERSISRIRGHQSL